MTQIWVGRGATALRDVAGAAREASTPLVWVLDTSAQPDARALPALARHAVDAAAVSVPVDRAGEPDETWMGTFADADVEAVLAGAADRVVPLRFTPLYSLLARRDVLADAPLPDEQTYGPYADVEWTARLFRGERGLLVTESEVGVAPRRLPVAPATLARIVRSDGFRVTDGLRLARVARQTI